MIANPRNRRRQQESRKHQDSRTTDISCFWSICSQVALGNAPAGEVSLRRGEAQLLGNARCQVQLGNEMKKLHKFSGRWMRHEDWEAANTEARRLKP